MRTKTIKYPTWIWPTGLILFGSILFSLIFYISLYCPVGEDKTVYQYVAKVMLEGQVLYRDVFDHKGPVVYLWHVLGALFSPKTGVWGLEFIWLIITLIYAFKMASRFTSPFWAFCITLFLFSTLNYPEGIGNTESLSLLFLFIFLNKFCSYVLGTPLKKTDGLTLGICLSALLLIKPIHLIMPITLGLYALVIGFQRKDWATFKKLFLPSFISFFGIIIIVLSYFIYHKALVDFWETYIMFNLRYTQDKATSINQWISFFFFLSQEAIFLPAGCSIFLLFNKSPLIKKIGIPISLAFLTTFWIIILPGRCYQHYFIIILPLSLLLLALEVDSLRCFWKIIFLFFISFLFIQNLWNLFLFSYRSTNLSKQNEKIFVAALKREIPPDETFLDLSGSYARLFLLSDRNSYSKHPFTYSVLDDIAQELEIKGLPTYIVTVAPENFLDNILYDIIFQQDVYYLLKKKPITQLTPQ